MPTSSFGAIRRLPSGRYQARYLMPGTGERRTAPATFRTKRGAADFLAETRAQMVRGDWRDPNTGALPLADYARDYLATRVDLAPSTRALYATQLRRFIAAALPDPTGGAVNIGAAQVRALDLPLIRRWYAAVTLAAAASAADRGTHRQRVHPARVWARSAGLDAPDTGRLPRKVVSAWHAAGRPTPATASTGETGRTQAAQAYRVLRVICAAAVDDGLLQQNPCRLPRAGRTAPAERVPATPAEVDALAAAMPAHLAAAVHVAAWSGLRAGELFALDRSRVNLDAGTVRVDRTLAVVRSVVTGYGPPKTESSRRTVHLPPHVVVILAAHMRAHTARGTSALIFAAPGGGPVTPAQRQRAFTRARTAAGRTDLRWHDLRHTGATLAAQTGASVRELQHRLGHSTVAAAMLYQHHADDRDRDLAARLSALAHTAPAATAQETHA